MLKLEKTEFIETIAIFSPLYKMNALSMTCITVPFRLVGCLLFILVRRRFTLILIKVLKNEILIDEIPKIKMYIKIVARCQMPNEKKQRTQQTHVTERKPNNIEIKKLNKSKQMQFFGCRSA